MDVVTQPFQTRSSVLMINHPQQQRVELGAHCVQGFEQAQINIKQNNYSVIVLPIESENIEELKQLISDLEIKGSEPLLVLVRGESSNELLIKILSRYYIYKIVDSYDDARLEKYVFEALEKSDLIKQNKQLVQLINDQNMKLVALKEDLQFRINRRKKTLLKSQKRFETINQKINAINEAYVYIHQSSDINSLEKLLFQSLKNAFDLEQIKIYFNLLSDNSALPEVDSQQSLFSIPLIIQQKQLGQILFIRSGKKTFSKEDKELLNEVSEAVVISLDRLDKREQAQVLKIQWQSTFNAFENPICITNERFQILQTNNSFSETSPEVVSINVFEAFFSDSKLQEKFNSEENSIYFQKAIIGKSNNNVTYEVIAQKIPFDDIESEHVWLFIIRDISENVRLERQILESSKMAELGTIGSSIAHEINNPLGGMINFLQLIKMDLTDESPLTEDIDTMLTASLKCKGIVENLLGFARKSSIYEQESVNISEALEQAISISEIQTMSSNIKILFKSPSQPFEVMGNQNQLVQAFCNLIQNSIEAIKDSQKQDAKFSGDISITIDEQRLVHIQDNGIGILPEHMPLIFNPLFTSKNPSNNSGLGLTLAYQIFNDHDAKLEIFSQPMDGTSAKIAF